jgi:hypothetical protein
VSATKGDKMTKFEVGEAVYHRNLELSGIVVEPPFLGIDEGFTTLVEFEDGETREVSSHLLDRNGRMTEEEKIECRLDQEDDIERGRR